MPMEGVEIVRRGYEAYEARGIEGILEFLDPEIEWRNPTDSPIAGVFHGHEGVREWQRQADEAWDEIKFIPEEILDAPDGRVLAICTGRIRGRSSGAVVEVPFAHVIEVRGGKATAFRMYPDVSEARAAVGFSA